MTPREWKRLNAITKRIFKHLNCYYCEDDPKLQAALHDLYAFVTREERRVENPTQPSPVKWCECCDSPLDHCNCLGPRVYTEDDIPF